VLLDERLEELGREQRRVAGEDEDVRDVVPNGGARRADGTGVLARASRQRALDRSSSGWSPRASKRSCPSVLLRLR